MSHFDEDYTLEREVIDRIQRYLPEYTELHRGQSSEMERLKLIQQLSRDVRLLEEQEKLAAGLRFIQAQRDLGAAGYV